MAIYTGTSAGNTYTGTASADTISGEFGNDTLNGGDGGDLIYGEAQIDPLIARGTETGAASTLSYTNNTTDTLYIYSVNTDGSISRMTAIAPGATVTQSVPLNAGRVIGNLDGTDYYTVVKMPGTAVTSFTIASANDSITGGAGNDSIYGQAGADYIDGGADNDVIEGGTGNDTILGQAGTDTISGGDGVDSLIGGAGADVMSGGNDNDYIEGNDGADVIHGGSGDDRVLGGNENDSIMGDSGNDTLFGEVGSDTLDGSLGNDSILGGADNDVITGGADNDTLLGEAGNDNISGGGDNDSILGGDGNDTLKGDSGADIIDGGIGIDQLEGGIGNDTLTGNDGDDTIYGNSAAGDVPDDDVVITAGTLTANDVRFTNLDGPTQHAGSHWTTVTLNGVPHVITDLQAYDGYMSIYRLNNDGTLTKTDWMTYQDSNGTVTTGSDGVLSGIPAANLPAFGNATSAIAVEEINGVHTIFLTSSNGSGITAWTLNNNGTIDYRSSLQYGSSQTGINGGNTIDQEVYTASNGRVFIYASRGQNNFLSRLEYNPTTGAFTLDNTFNVPTGTNPAGLGTIRVGGVDYLSVANNTGVQLFQINPTTGNLTLTSSVTATSQSARGDADVYVKPDGTVYLAYSNSSAEEVVLYRVGVGGTLTQTDSLVGQGDYNALHSKVNYIEGQPIVVVTDVTGSMTRLYSISADGTFVLETEIPGMIDTTNPPIIVRAANGTYYLVNGSTGETVRLDFVRQASGDNDVIDGGIGNDFIYGQAGNDTITGGDGLDRIDGGDGNDSIFGNAQNDSVTGGLGSDTIDGGADNDTLSGGLGNDSLLGGAGLDTLLGDDGNDTLDGGIGNDSLSGGIGTDSLLGGDGDDALDGGADNDTLRGGNNNDTVLGGGGDDLLFGDAGADSIGGGTGNDLIDGGAGADTNQGGEGFDTFIAGTGDLITDFNTATGQNFTDGNQANNDFVDLSGYYNQTNLDAYNAMAVQNGLRTYLSPLGWMRADQAADGILNQAGITLNIQNGGAAVAGADLTYDNTNVICFGADALIRTVSGEVPAGELSVGDLVETADAGPRAIRWIGRRTLDAAMLEANPKLRPIRICKGALGAGLPEADLIVSPQHRMLVRSQIAQRMFGTDEVLVAAKQLCQISGIDVADDLDSVTYVHFMFDAHQIVTANGAESESLLPGAEALNAVGPAALAEIFAIFPELASPEHHPVAVRELASGRMARKLAVRHAQNRKPLVQ